MPSGKVKEMGKRNDFLALPSSKVLDCLQAGLKKSEIERVFCFSFRQDYNSKGFGCRTNVAPDPGCRLANTRRKPVRVNLALYTLGEKAD